MRSPFVSSLILAGALTSAQGFSLDFTNFFNEGDEFIITSGAGNSGVFEVDGFGNLTFIIPPDQAENSVSLGTNYGDSALELDAGESILVQFNQDPDLSENIANVMISFVGGGTGSYSVFDDTPTQPLIGRIDWSGGNGGIESISFETTTIPEPSVSLLAAVAGLALLRHRR